ncbi:hypothetical protein [Chamaesiphon sp.]|uniref:hypothetical protein n=1 Tax=Chamaesiphon sp. TaxID=2814140 RepID=UPI003593D49A
MKTTGWLKPRALAVVPALEPEVMVAELAVLSVSPVATAAESSRTPLDPFPVALPPGTIDRPPLAELPSNSIDTAAAVVPVVAGKA